MKILLLLLLVAPAFGQVVITQQEADQAAIPGSKRSLYADVEGTANLTVNWSASGGCTLAHATTTASPQVVTAPLRGSACKFTTDVPTNATPSFQSATSCTITAASAADPGKTAAIVIPVCAPSVMLSTFPASTVLYRNQFAVIQSDLRGSVDTGVTWKITANPGGAGTLTGGATNRHAVFSARAAGIYVLSATSDADASKTALTTIRVTSDDLPAPNADHTEPVDCTAVGNGRTYEVGPDRKYSDLNAVPWPMLKGGDTVRIHNDDASGTSPTIYRQNVSISTSGTQSEPIRVCGVPDKNGVKPIIDGDNATTRPDEDWAGGYLATRSVVTLYRSKERFDARSQGLQHIVVEGLHIRDASPAYMTVKSGTTAAVPYIPFSACVWIQMGVDVTIRGNELDHCSQGIFSNAQTPNGNMVYDTTVEGNSIHDWGVAKVSSVHAMYLQGIGLQVQFNAFGEAVDGAKGNLIKTRSVLNFLRWNYMPQTATTARGFDIVEPQGYVCYVIPYDFAVVFHGSGKGDCHRPSRGPEADPTSPDEVAANFEAYHSDYVYGNILDDAGTFVPFVHYGYDIQMAQIPGYDRRGGTLYYWNNTHISRRDKGVKVIFDAAAPDAHHSYEFPVTESVNNVFAVSDPALSYQWTRPFWAEVIVDSNWISPKYALPDLSSVDTYQGGTPAAMLATCSRYNVCKPGEGHMVWERDGKPGSAASTLYTGSAPFNEKTYLPGQPLKGRGATLPIAIRDQPSNMQYIPMSGTIAPRPVQRTLGALE